MPGRIHIWVGLRTACLLAANEISADSQSASASITVFSQTSGGYQAPNKADLEKKPITYAITFAKAAQFTSDAQVTNPRFASAMAQSLAENLRLQGFELAVDSEAAEQLLVVHAGTTRPPQRISFGPELFAHTPSRADQQLWARNSHLLGYAGSYNDLDRFLGMSIQQTMQQDLTNDMNAPRNYLVITAYDFALAQSGKRPPHALANPRQC